jgi:hypothetical protein
MLFGEIVWLVCGGDETADSGVTGPLHQQYDSIVLCRAQQEIPSVP